MDLHRNFSAIGDFNLNSSCSDEISKNILYWALNCYGVSIVALVTNLTVGTIGIIIVFLNSVAVLAVFQRPEIDNSSDLLIAALGLADSVVGIFLIYQSAYNLGNWQIFEECLFRLGILLGADLTSVFHLCLLTLDRYVKITRPYLYQRIFRRKTVIGASIVLWIVALAVGFLPMFGWNNGFPPPTAIQCGFFVVLDQDYNLLLVLLFFIPFILNIILYGHIFTIALRHAKVIADQQTALSKTTGPSRKTWKFTKTVCILMGFYFVCWTPTGIFLLLDYFGDLKDMDVENKGLIVMYLSVLAYINSMVNPIIYAVKITYIKQRFARLPCCRCLRTKPRTTETTWESVTLQDL